MAVLHTPPTATDITRYTEHSTRGEIEQALGDCNHWAKRCTARDNLGRVSAEWTRMHRFLDYLLDLWQRTTA